MKRKIKPQPEPKQPDSEVEPKVLIEYKVPEEMEAYARRPRARRARGMPFPWADRIWLRYNSADPNWLWYHMFDAVDRHGNKKPLIKMLRDPKCEVTPAVRECLADLLERHKLVRLPGEQRIPIYAVSQAEAMFLMMRDEVLKLTANGTPRDKAIERVADAWHIDESILVDALNNRRESLNRVLDRRARLRCHFAATKSSR
jgi:hypothetical protein